MDIKEFKDNGYYFQKGENIFYTDSELDKELLNEAITHFKSLQDEKYESIHHISPINVFKKRKDSDFSYLEGKDDRYIHIDVETDGLYGRLLSVGMIVTNKDLKIEKIYYFYDDTVDTQNTYPTDFTKDYVLKRIRKVGDKPHNSENIKDAVKEISKNSYLNDEITKDAECFVIKFGQAGLSYKKNEDWTQIFKLEEKEEKYRNLQEILPIQNKLARKKSQFRYATDQIMRELIFEVVNQYQISKVYTENLYPSVWEIFQDKLFDGIRKNTKHVKEGKYFELIDIAPEMTTSYDEGEDIFDRDYHHVSWYDAFKVAKEFISYMKREAPYSSHVFILPFRIKYGKQLQEDDNNVRFKPDSSDWELLDSTKDWTTLPYFKHNYPLTSEAEKSKEYLSYNFSNFFNNEVHQVLKGHTDNYIYKSDVEQYYQIHRYLINEIESVYTIEDYQKWLLKIRNFEKLGTGGEQNWYYQELKQRLRQYKIKGHKVYDISKEGAKSRIYELKINYIVMRLVKDADSYESGFLIISTNNNHYSKQNEINEISQYGRHVYAPFYVEKYSERDNASDLVIATESIEGKEKFWNNTDVQLEKNNPNNKFRIMSGINMLLQSFFGDKVEQTTLLADSASESEKAHILRILDNRMFVHANYKFNNYHFNQIKDGYKGVDFSQYHDSTYANNLHKEIYEYQRELYAYTYIDSKGSSSQSPISIRKLLDASIYDRWIDYGTIYGISQHSMIMMTSPGVPKYLLAYFYSEYLEMILFVLTQRISILTFSARAGEVSENINKHDISQESLALQKDYILFKNQFLLPEMSSQEQPIELYALMQDNLYVTKQKELLDDQIQSLYEINQAESDIEQRKIDEQREISDRQLNIILFVISALTLLTSFNDVYGSLNSIANDLGLSRVADTIAKKINFPQFDNIIGISFVIWFYYQILKWVCRKLNITLYTLINVIKGTRFSFPKSPNIMYSLVKLIHHKVKKFFSPKR